MAAPPPSGDAWVLFSKHRLEALADGIFAVAMTLLVIELRVPEHAAGGRELLRALALQIPTFIAWMISFLVLAIFWSTQQRLFHYVRSVNVTLSWLTIGYLGLVTLMPFSSALIGRLGSVLLSHVINSTHMAVLALVSLYMTRYVCQHPELWAGEIPARFYAAVRIRSLGLVAVALAAVGITRLAPGFGGLAFLLMIPISRISRRFERGSR